MPRRLYKLCGYELSILNLYKCTFLLILLHLFYDVPTYLYDTWV